MNTDVTAGGTAAIADRFDHAEALLARYPGLTEEELLDLTHWFRKEASAFDVASLASKESVAEPYRLFRAEHVDRFRVKEAIILAGGLIFVTAAIVGMTLVA
jgi:hypothetical protein